MNAFSLLAIAILAAPADDAAAVRVTIGHRGSLATHPGNTIVGFKYAIETKVDVVELDVRTTQDGQLILLHDAEVDPATDGKGKVNDLTLKQIQVLDVGTKFDKKYAGERIPTFRDALELCKGKCAILIDLKEHGETYTKQIAHEVTKFGEPRRVYLGVRRLDHVEQFRKLLPDATMIGLVSTANDIELFHKAGVKVIRLWTKWLSDESLIPRVRKLGGEILLNAEKAGKDEIIALLRHRPEYLSADNPKVLVVTLRDLKSGK